MIIEQINNNFFCYTNTHVIHTKEYYDYIVGLIKNWLSLNDLKINVILGNYTVNFNNQNKTIKLDIQCEHTLVVDGGRSVNDKIFGKVECNDGFYLIRIDNFNYYNNLDLVIEYSLPNIHNISTNDSFIDYLSRIIYVPPIIYEINFDKQHKKELLCLFVKDNNERRTKTLNSLEQLGLPIKTVTNCFSKDCLVNLYKETKILINIHQTDHHHTFEELRVLPALLNGVLIISEDVPLKDKIPYGEFIIWSQYDDISKKVKEVNENYEYYYNEIFNNSKLSSILIEMKKNNDKIFEKIKL